MLTIILLCGTNESGKTTTLKHFFGVSHIYRLKPYQPLERKLNGKSIRAVSLSSPQELSKFCQYETVIEKILRRIKLAEKAFGKGDYYLLVPYGVYQKNRHDTTLNEDCLIKPIGALKSLGHNVIGIYLRKDGIPLIVEKDVLVRKITSYEIKSNKQYERQAKELEEIILKLLKLT